MKTPPFFKRLSCALAGAFLAAALPFGAAAGEDVDIFAGTSGTATDPNVLIILDSSSNWSSTLGINSCSQVPGYTGNMADNTKFAAEVCALRTVLGVLPANMRLGLMMFSETGTNGGYVRFGIRNMTGTVGTGATPSTGNKGALFDMLGNWVQNGAGTDNSGSNQPYGKVMYEAWKYFRGENAFAGGNSNPVGAKRRDYAGNNTGGATQANANRAADKYGADANNALPQQATDQYTSPVLSDCAKNFIVFISNGNPGTGGDSGSPDAATLLSGIGGSTAAVMSGGTAVHASLMDEYARYFFSTDVITSRPGEQKIRTYTIAVYQPQANGSISNTDQQMIKLMKSAAAVGGGKYFAATQANDIANALLTILNEVQAVNSVFVSASLPVSVNTQGTFLNQVYMGLFRPDAGGNPRWLGNVKQFKFIQDSGTGDIFLADSTGQRAVNPATGFITPASTSFWTTASAFWANDPKGIPPSPSDAPDGDVVEKGGASEVQRVAWGASQATRRMYTCPTGGCGTPAGLPGTALTTPFDNTTITAAYQGAFGAASAAELTLLVDWIRGQDNAGGATFIPLVIGQAPCNPAVAPCTWTSAENGPGWPTTVRPSVHGDVLHSRPVVLNYCSVQSQCPGANLSQVSGPYIFYGSNSDGTLRAVKGGQASGDGVEVWSFIAPEFFSKYGRHRYQSPQWRTPNTPAALFATPKDYFFDGPIGSYEDPTTSPPTKLIFVAARRGGRVIYAFNVTNPEQPMFLWRKTHLDLGNMGQTWSLPVAFKLTNAPFPYLVFGAGYDPGEDSTPAVPNVANPLTGRGIYVLNALTGEPVSGGPSSNGFISTGTSGTVMSPIASDMAFLARINPSGGFGDVYRGYVGDLGGNVWRLDIPDFDVANWKLHKLASLGAGRKFLFAPDLVKAGNRDIVLIGSGDREKPLVTTTQDTFFGIADFNTLPTAFTGTMVPVNIGNLTSLAGDTGLATNCTTCAGWYRDLAVGEKVVNSPLTVAGITYFSTNKPVPTPPSSCEANLGEARAYGLSFLTGAKPASRGSISTVLTGGGLAPSPVGGVVELEPGKLVTFVIGSGKDGSRLEPERPPLNVPTNRTKIFWNTKTDG